jgi:hypothetical protein
MNVKMIRRSMVFLLLLCVLYVSAVLTGCACHPSPEQLNQLEMTKAAALAAEEAVKAKTQERMEWEAKLEEKQAALQKAENDLKVVQEELAKEGKK